LVYPKKNPRIISDFIKTKPGLSATADTVNSKRQIIYLITAIRLLRFNGFISGRTEIAVSAIAFRIQ
jgi:hypothetical protein